MLPWYASELSVGLVRAALWSGGWYWRLPLVVALTPAVRDEEPFSWALQMSGLEGVSSWFFVFVAAGAAAIVFGVRLALLETPRIRIAKLEWRDDGNGTVFVRARLENRSMGNCDDAMLQLVGIEQPPPLDQEVRQKIDLPLVLTTQQRLRRALDGVEPIPQRRFNLSKGNWRNVELFQVQPSLANIDIQHESGKVDLTLYHTLFHYELVGCGAVIRFSVKLLADGDHTWPILIRDRVDDLVVGSFGDVGWWEPHEGGVDG